MSAYQHSKWS